MDKNISNENFDFIKNELNSNLFLTNSDFEICNRIIKENSLINCLLDEKINAEGIDKIILGNVNKKSVTIEVKKSRNNVENLCEINESFQGFPKKIFGFWENGSRRSAFQPYKPATVLTNLQRGNIQAKTPQLDETLFTWHIKAGRGDLRFEDIMNATEINKKDEFDMTALMWSSAYGQTTTVARLLKRHCNPIIRGRSQQTALHMAAYGGHHEIIKLLIMHGAEVNAIDETGNTAIMYAVQEDNPHAVYELLVAGADIYIANFNNLIPYKLAIENNSLQAKVVLENHMIKLLTSELKP